MTHAALPLACEFPTATEADWLKLVDGVLKGAPFDKKLVGKTRDDLAIQPLYPRRRNAAPIAGTRGAAPWGIAARLDHPDAEIANRLALEELDGGADTLILSFAGSPMARGFGLPVPSLATLNAALKGVHCDLVALRLEAAPFNGREAALALVDLAQKRRLPAAVLRVDFGLQPLADIAMTGASPLPFAVMADNLVAIIRDLRERGFSGPFIRCDSRPFHEAGASEAQELASLIAQGVTYLRVLGARGMAPAESATMLSFTLTADVDQFLTIAKIRALRLLWARIEEASGLAPQPIKIHVESAWRMLSARDPYVNVLRGTIAAFSAGIAGADSLHVLPFTAALGLADGFARRLARNTSHVLIEEANLHRVIDPACGAGGFEALTDALCETGWSHFQAIEREGTGETHGLVAALASGTFRAAIAQTHAARARDIATRREPITGTSEFPNMHETREAVLIPAPARPASAGFPSERLAEPFERLRERAEALASAGEAPKAFLANLGAIADFNARATFAKNVFEAGGIEAIGNDGFTEGAGTDLVAMTEAFKASGARIACLCASDALYAEEASDAAMALIASGATIVALAGRPGAHEALWRMSGVSLFLYAGCDILALLAGLIADPEAAP